VVVDPFVCQATAGVLLHSKNGMVTDSACKFQVRVCYVAIAVDLANDSVLNILVKWLTP
jgi:hypothetical protein